MSGSSSIHRRGFSSSFRNTIVVTKKKKTLKKKSTSTVSAFGGGGRVGAEKSNTDRPMSEVLEKQYQKLKEIQENAGTTPMDDNNKNNTAYDGVVDVGNRFLEDAKTRIF